MQLHAMALYKGAKYDADSKEKARPQLVCWRHLVNAQSAVWNLNKIGMLLQQHLGGTSCPPQAPEAQAVL